MGPQPNSLPNRGPCCQQKFPQKNQVEKPRFRDAEDSPERNEELRPLLISALMILRPRNDRCASPSRRQINEHSSCQKKWQISWGKIAEGSLFR
jgi:hypothetical protein